DRPTWDLGPQVLRPRPRRVRDHRAPPPPGRDHRRSRLPGWRRRERHRGAAGHPRDRRAEPHQPAARGTAVAVRGPEAGARVRRRGPQPRRIEHPQRLSPMAEIVFDEQTIKYVALFQDLTRTTVIDCVDASDKLIFVVKEGDIGKAIGKKGENIAKLKRLMNRDIHVVEYSDQPDQFVANHHRATGPRSASAADPQEAFESSTSGRSSP